MRRCARRPAFASAGCSRSRPWRGVSRARRTRSPSSSWGRFATSDEINGVTLRSARATLTNSGCSFEGPLQDTVRAAVKATDAKPVCLVVDGDIDLRIPGRPQPLAVRGGLVVDLATLQFSVSGGLSSDKSFGPAEFNLSSVRLWATNTPAARAVCGAGAAALEHAIGSGAAGTRRRRGKPELRVQRQGSLARNRPDQRRRRLYGRGRLLSVGGARGGQPPRRQRRRLCRSSQ